MPSSNVAGKKLLRVSQELIGFCGAESMADLDLTERVSVWQDAGYDGMCFSVALHGSDVGYANMSGRWWAPVPRSYTELEPEIEAFRAVPDWGRLTDNLLWTMTSVWGDTKCQDWFNDEHWDILLSNARLAARLAKECGFKGILLDTEQYAHHARGPWRFLWDYKRYAETGYRQTGDETPKPFLDVAAKVRERSKAYAEAITSVFPDLVLFVIAGLYENAWSAVRGSADGTLPGCNYALYPAFVDGLLLGLDEKATLVAGNERTYLDSRYKDMLAVRDAELRDALVLSACPELARRRITFAASIWTDAGWGATRFSDTDAAWNQRDPERHKHAVHSALAVSDRYAWQWGQQPWEWLALEPTPLIQEYWKANVEGHSPLDLDWEPVPRWDLTDYTQYNREMAERDARFWADAEKGGWTVAAELPVRWKFLFDTETLIRYRGQWLSPKHNDAAWHTINILECWQAQGTQANGPAVYRVWFDAPADLDPARQEIVLAFSAFPPDDVENTGWMDLHLNQNGHPMRHLIDVRDSIRPGARNFAALRVINRKGPGGPAGHAKLLVRGGHLPAAEPAQQGEVVFQEDFERFDDGTPLSAAGWTTSHDVTITSATVFGAETKAVDGKTPAKEYFHGFADFSAAINAGDSVTFRARVYHAYGGSWAHTGLHTAANNAVMLGNNGWTWHFDARAIGAEKGIDFWSWSLADPWNRVLAAAIHIDSETYTAWATLTDQYGTVHASPKVAFAPGQARLLTGAWLAMSNTEPGRNMDVDDIRVTRIPRERKGIRE